MVLKWMSVHGLDGAQKADFSTGEGMRVRIGYDGLAKPDETYFCLLIHNSAQERMTTIYSTDNGIEKQIGSAGVIECTVPSLMLNSGLYSVMLDTGTFDSTTWKFLSLDCVSFGTFIRITDTGKVKRPTLNEFQGVFHRSEWSVGGHE
jgi:hypothetical protein